MKNIKGLIAGAKLGLKKVSPKVTFVGGVVFGVGALAMAVVQTFKLEPVIDEAKEQIEDVKSNEKMELIDHKEATKDLGKIYGKTTLKMAKLYSLPFALEVASVAMFLWSNHIYKSRAAAYAAAYAAVSEAFKAYRQRVVDDQGAEKDREYYSGRKKVVTKEVNAETGKEEEKVEYFHGRPVSQYARIFDCANINWTTHALTNQAYLKGIQDYCNELLKIRGHLFLNEVYDQLGFVRTKAGAIVGWKNGGEGDQYVDFGIWDADGFLLNHIDPYEAAIWLDFNVDGPIIDDVFDNPEFNYDGVI